MVFDFNYTVSSCSICVVHLFFSCVVVISSCRTHGTVVVLPAVTTSYNMISPVEILLKPNPQEIYFHEFSWHEWINETCVNSAWIFRPFSCTFCYIAKSKNVQTTCN